MSNDGWPAELARSIAGEVRRYRKARGLTAQQLAKRCADLGLPIPHAVLANFETGRRPTLSVAELLVLAAALEVSPLVLAVPVGRRESMQILPAVDVSTWQAAEWWQGSQIAVIDATGKARIGPISGADGLRAERSESARQALRQGSEQRLDEGDMALIYQDLYSRISRWADDVFSDSGNSEPGRPGAEDVESAWAQLSSIRAFMRANGFIPPPLRAEFARLQERDDARSSGH